MPAEEPFTDEERRELTARLNNLRAQNSAAEKRVLAQGVRPTALDVIGLQLETIKDLIVGDDEDAKLAFQVRYQGHVAAMLAKLEEGIPKAKLTVPGKVLQLPKQ